jgi:hypothetical protein
MVKRWNVGENHGPPPWTVFLMLVGVSYLMYVGTR